LSKRDVRGRLKYRDVIEVRRKVTTASVPEPKANLRKY